MTSPRILIADDTPDIVEILRLLLEAQGFRVAVAQDGEEAVRMAMADPPDLLLLDLMMPKKSGYDVCRELRADPRLGLLPILMLTAKSQAADRLLGFEVGADDYILKPFDPGELVARVRAALRRRAPGAAPPGEAVAPEVAASGLPALDAALSGGLPRGSNLLLTGPIGSGKSSLARRFLATGLAAGEPGLFLSVDDAPAAVRQALDASGGGLAAAEAQERFRLVDAYSWCAGGLGGGERFAVSGILELTQLSGIVADAAAELGQTVQVKRGGRRVVDSISSLLVNFELPSVQRFVAHLARSGAAAGGVSTLFVAEEGGASEQALTNIRYVMDGTLECRRTGEGYQVRVASMKWRQAPAAWIDHCR